MSKVITSFSWLRQPRQLLIVGLLMLLSTGLGVWAYQPPLSYQLNIGGNDGPFVRNVNTRRLTRVDENRSMRWLRGQSSIYLPAVNVSYPITLSLYTGGGGRRDVAAGKAVTLTLLLNDQPLGAIRLDESSHWYRWRIEPQAFISGRLKLDTRIGGQIGDIITWPEGVLAEWLTIEPAVPAASIAPLADLDWREVSI